MIEVLILKVFCSAVQWCYWQFFYDDTREQIVWAACVNPGVAGVAGVAGVEEKRSA
jgi:hypothetical protein